MVRECHTFTISSKASVASTSSNPAVIVWVMTISRRLSQRSAYTPPRGFRMMPGDAGGQTQRAQEQRRIFEVVN